LVDPPEDIRRPETAHAGYCGGGDHQASECGVIGEGEHAPVSHMLRRPQARRRTRAVLLDKRHRDARSARLTRLVRWFFQTCEDATMSTERREWTKFVEQREREKKVKRPRTKKQPETAPAELEAALDDLVGEAERGRARLSTLPEKALCCQSHEM
jgi:hypothetical protein